VPGRQEVSHVNTTNRRGTPDDSARRRPSGHCRRWPVAGALAAALLGLTLLAAGCASGPATTRASGVGTAADSAVTDPLVLKGDQDLVNFARCMRAHGVQMSDPYHQAGHVGLTVVTPSHDATTARAYARCGHYMQALIQIKEARTAALASSRLAALTRYAGCMRAHDINMLDPNAHGELDLGDVPGTANNGFGRTSPQFRSADATCRHVLPPGITDDGTGP
jgi:hypothetical protein